MDLSVSHVVKSFDSAFCRRERAEKDKGNILGFIRNGQGTDRQFDWFVPDKGNGLTRAGLSRLNQSIEAFLYCILGEQVKVRSSILIEAILMVMEAGKRSPEPDSHIVGGRSVSGSQLAKSVQRYQLAVDKAKVRLDLAATPGAWMMPSHMAINTGRTVAYNNKLRQAAPNMNLWLNNDVNKDTKKVGLRLMAEFLSKLIRQTITHLIPFTRRK